MWARLNVITTLFPDGDLRRAADETHRSFPKLFMELRDAIGCAVLRESKREVTLERRGDALTRRWPPVCSVCLERHEPPCY